MIVEGHVSGQPRVISEKTTKMTKKNVLGTYAEYLPKKKQLLRKLLRTVYIGST